MPTVSVQDAFPPEDVTCTRSFLLLFAYSEHQSKDKFTSLMGMVVVPLVSVEA
jgi:hypothetical protein